jgi:hypothetical protein
MEVNKFETASTGSTIRIILPGSSLEVIKSEFFFQLLMRLFANPSCLDGGG